MLKSLIRIGNNWSANTDQGFASKNPGIWNKLSLSIRHRTPSDSILGNLGRKLGENLGKKCSFLQELARLVQGFSRNWCVPWCVQDIVGLRLNLTSLAQPWQDKVSLCPGILQTNKRERKSMQGFRSEMSSCMVMQGFPRLESLGSLKHSLYEQKARHILFFQSFNAEIRKTPVRLQAYKFFMARNMQYTRVKEAASAFLGCQKDGSYKAGKRTGRAKKFDAGMESKMVREIQSEAVWILQQGGYLGVR